MTTTTQTLQPHPKRRHTLKQDPIRPNPLNSQSLIIRAKNPFFGRWERSSGNSCQFLIDDLVTEEIEVEIVLVVSKGILDFGSYGCESYDDE